MPAIRPRAAWVTGLLASAVTTSLLTGVPAHAVVGEAAKDGTFAFTAKLDIGGGQRSCSAALVEQEWLVTAASCFADNPAQGFKVAAGAPKLKTTATIGRTDLTRDGGVVANVVELVPSEGRDLVMARLDQRVTGVTPVGVGFNAVLPGEDLWVSGYGRTKDEWVPDRLHYAKFSVGTVKDTSLGLTGKSGDAVVCQGDTGGPAFRDIGGRYELVGVNSTSGQGGCFGSDESETRKGAVDTRVDDIAGWIQTVSSRNLLSRVDWKNAAYMASGYFTGNSAGAKRRMDLFVAWKDGSASIFQGADHNNPKPAFSIEHKVAPAGSYWKDARAVTAGNFTGSGSDGITVRWASGKLSTYTHVDQNGFHDEKTLAYSDTWKRARLITAGRYTANALRDDLVVVWDDGKTGLYADTDTNQVSKEYQINKGDSWAAAEQITSGEFTGGSTADLVIRWSDGSASLLGNVDSTGYHGRTSIRSQQSAWKNAQILTTGSFTAAANRPNDILVRWAAGPLSYYPGVDAAGTHGEVQLVD
ncbi:S1 family peptidase [Streptomyces olivoreticuli]|uniref:S1 family peptidase n=1 Tax=Streptomyces olivoreticuli TaxID=68246 RepID=UPI00265B0356|nr:S1 family peptidase [Streptomyces olivoreticuli]WKK25963.1 S1 family peptidase [Streptomyces olivoreticuli]